MKAFVQKKYSQFINFHPLYIFVPICIYIHIDYIHSAPTLNDWEVSKEVT